jgi:hypothetical protein
MSIRHSKKSNPKTIKARGIITNRIPKKNTIILPMFSFRPVIISPVENSLLPVFSIKFK